MESNLAGYMLHVCEILNKHEIEYMIVGGMAMALHGYYRKSIAPDGTQTDKPDVDIWYNPTYGNYFRLLDALEELGQDISKFKNEQAPNPKKSFFKYNFDEFTLDFIPQLKANLSFPASYIGRRLVDLNNTDIPYINLEDLISDKKANARQKDLEDIAYLERKMLGN
jgi:hypothetical protein